MIQVKLTVGETTLDIPAQNFNRNDVIKIGTSTKETLIVIKINLNMKYVL